MWVNYLVKVMLFFFMMAIPISLTVSDVFLFGALGVFFLSYPFIRKEYDPPGRHERKMLLLSPFVLYLLVFVSFIYSSDPGAAFRYISVRLTFGLLPLMFFAGFRLTRREFEAIASGIVPGVFIMLLYYVVLGAYWLWTGVIDWSQVNVYTLDEVDLPLRFHRTYISLYILMALVAILFSRYIKYKAWFKVVMVLLSAVSILFLESRVMVGLLIALMLVYPFVAFRGKARIKAFSIVCCALILSLSVAYFTGNIASLTERFSQVPEDMNNEVYWEKYGYDSRAARWSVAMDKIKERPLTGYGAGTEKKVLNEPYKERGLYFSYVHKVNVHNQYISFTLENGVFAFLLYLLVLAAAFWKSLKQRNVIACCFVVVVCVMGMFENILNVHWTISIFAFMITAIMFSDGRNKGGFKRG